MTRAYFSRVLATLVLNLVTTLPVWANQVITFDMGLDTGAAPSAPFLRHENTLVQGDFGIVTVSTKFGAQPSDLVGAVIDSSNAVSTCAGRVCPNNDATRFLGMLNDGVPYVYRLDGFGFQIKSFNASFIAVEADVVPLVSLLLRVYGFAADNSSWYEDVLLPGPDSNGAYDFSTYNLSDDFANRSFIQVAFYGFACNVQQTSCGRANNKAQFALDNITLSDPITVPEPSSMALVGLAIAGLGLFSRRRTIAAA